MGLSKATLRYILAVSALFGALIISLIIYRVIAKPPPTFLTTSSPEKTYTVYLTGQKEQPLFFTVEVRFHVMKNGTRFLSNKYLHSGDSEDMSFEMRYPNHRWVNENTLQFYREEYFHDGKPDTVVVVNNTGETIKYTKIESVDAILLFDLQPGFTGKMLTPRPRGDSKWVDVVGEFSDGRKIEGTNKDLLEHKDPIGPNTYYITINADGTTVEIRD